MPLSPLELSELAKVSPFYAMRLMGEQQDNRQDASLLMNRLAQPQGVPPPPMAGPGGMAPPPAGTPQGGPMPPPPGANPAPMPPQGGMPPGQPPMQPGQMPRPPMAMGAPGPGGPPMPGPAAPPPAPPPQVQPFRPLPSAGPQPGPGMIGPPPAAPQPQGDGLLQPQSIPLPKVIQTMKELGIKPERTLDMLEAIAPTMNAQNQQELNMFKAQTVAAKAAEQFYKDRLTIELMGRRAGVQEKAEERKGRQGDTRLSQGQQRIDLTKKQLEGGDFTPQDISFWTEVLQKGGSLPPRLASTPGGKKLLADIMKGTARGNVSPVDMLANQAEFMGQKAGQRTLGTRTANIEMAATEARGLADLALKASDGWNRSNIRYFNDLQKVYQSKTSSPELRKAVAATTSFINAYARAINPQGVGTVADKEHAMEMIAPAFAKGDYQAAIDQLIQEIETAQASPGKVKESMRERFTGSGRQLAPKEALDYLQAHPDTAQQFSAKYGYLPAGVR